MLSTASERDICFLLYASTRVESSPVIRGFVDRKGVTARDLYCRIQKLNHTVYWHNLGQLAFTFAKILSSSLVQSKFVQDVVHRNRQTGDLTAISLFGSSLAGVIAERIENRVWPTSSLMLKLSGDQKSKNALSQNFSIFQCWPLWERYWLGWNCPYFWRHLKQHKEYQCHKLSVDLKRSGLLQETLTSSGVMTFNLRYA